MTVWGGEVCMYVCEGEKECVCMYVRKRGSVHVRLWGREGVRVYVWEREAVCMYVWEREKEYVCEGERD